MITRWKVSNFKSIYGDVELKLGKLTVFAGANSSGKSTLIQSILLVTQTLNDQYRSQPVVLNGPFINLGRFDDIKSDGGDSNRITFAWTCQPFPNSSVGRSFLSRSSLRARFYETESYKIKEVSCEIAFDAGGSKSPNDILQHRPQLNSTRLYGKFAEEKGSKQKGFNISIHRLKNLKPKLKKILGPQSEPRGMEVSGLSYDIKGDSEVLSEIRSWFSSANPVGCSLRHFFPDSYYINVDVSDEISKEIYKIIKRPSQADRSLGTVYSRGYLAEYSYTIKEILRKVVKNFDVIEKKLDAYSYPFAWRKMISTLSKVERSELNQDIKNCGNLLGRIQSTVKRTMPEEWKYRGLRLGQEPQFVSESIRYMYQSFPNSLRYLGPLRRSPKFSYPLPTASDLHGVGVNGEGTALVLEIQGNRDVKYIPSENFKEERIDKSISTQKLTVAVDDWLQYLGIGESVESVVQGISGHEVKIGSKNSLKKHNLAHVGVGISQVLPIIVNGLLSDEDSTLIFEQPELHLHPKVQALLGDFFLSMMLCSKQCIIETHSEHLINRLGRRVAASSSEDELGDSIKLFFSKMGKKGSSFKEVTIRESGVLSSWPDGFYDNANIEIRETLMNPPKKKVNRRRKKT